MSRQLQFGVETDESHGAAADFGLSQEEEAAWTQANVDVPAATKKQKTAATEDGDSDA
jgi:hypothetical protein